MGGPQQSGSPERGDPEAQQGGQERERGTGAPAAPTAAACLADRLRGDFDILSRRPEMIYLDTAATSLKPNAVLQARR